MVEIDVYPTKDGEIVLLHDGTLDRTTNGTGSVSNYTLAELKELDAGSWKSLRYRGRRFLLSEKRWNLLKTRFV